jgi:toxin ParE1/3/4
MGQVRPLRLRYTPQALAELETLLADIAGQAPRGARRVQARLKAVIDLLLQYPSIGQVTNRPGVRRIIASPYLYLTFYRVTEDEIIILSVRHGARR